MKTFIEKLQKLISNNLFSIIKQICLSINQIFSYLNNKLNIKNKKEQIKNNIKENKTIKNICDNGTLDDLYDKFIKINIFILILFSIVGCTSLTPTIYVAKQWEGHYYNIEDFKNKTKDIELNKDESIWVLSNKSLYRILKNTEEIK